VGEPERLNVVVVGHVDHGKSTLIGRLLFDTDSLPQGKTEAIRKACEAEGMEFEYAFLMDALLEEQEQNITIDTTRIPFHTAKRDYAIIDAPGHTEFLKNMVTGAANASAALLLIDSHEGIRDQSRRHAFLLGLLGVQQIVVLINKMDLGGYTEERYRKIVTEYSAFLKSAGLEAQHFIPIAAKHGENIAVRSSHMPWWKGPTVIEALDQFEDTQSLTKKPLRFFVQDVYRFDERRILAGRVESGTLRVGDKLIFAPSRRTSIVKSIERWSSPARDFAETGESIGITLVEQIFVERGAIAALETEAPVEGHQFKARIFWMAKHPLTVGRPYRLRLATQDVACEVQSIERIIDATTLNDVNRGERNLVQRHEVAEITVRTRTPVAFDDGQFLPVSGRFVLIEDRVPAGGGIVLPGDYFRHVAGGPTPVANLFWANGKVTPAQRARRNAHAGRVLWFTGLSGAGKSTIAQELERQLFNAGKHVFLIDGDNLRHGLCAGLGFSASDRTENIRRAAEVSKLFAEAGVICIAAFISPLRSDRDRARQLLPKGQFVEVFVDTPIEVCRQRDPKGLYVRADRGEIPEFTGVSAPYEAPLSPEVTLRTDRESVEASVTRILDFIAETEHGITYDI
jgi:bifunctional enzyme CysN/CysC